MSWCGFSVLAIAALKVGLVPWPAQAQVSPAEDQSIDLPQFTLEWAEQQPERIHVGDVLKLKISRLPVEPHIKTIGTQALVVLPEEFAKKMANVDPLMASGWIIYGKEQGFVREGEHFVLNVVPVVGGRRVLPRFSLSDGGTPLGYTLPMELDIIGENLTPSKDPENPFLGPVEIPYPAWVRFFIACIVLILTVILLAAVYRQYLKRKAARRISEMLAQPRDPAISAEELALKLLAALSVKGLKSQDEFKDLYFKISEILKNYLGDVFQFHAPESTTFELVGLLRQKRISSQHLKEIQEIFTEMDVVKFTDVLPEVKAPAVILQRAKDLVGETSKSFYGSSTHAVTESDVGMKTGAHLGNQS